MPTYDYSCRKCGSLQDFRGNLRSRKACPKCGRRTAHRMIGAGAGLLFKGSGFYITDYGRGGAKPAAAEAAPAAKAEKACAKPAGEGCACAAAKPKKGAKA